MTSPRAVRLALAEVSKSMWVVAESDWAAAEAGWVTAETVCWSEARLALLSALPSALPSRGAAGSRRAPDEMAFLLEWEYTLKMTRSLKLEKPELTGWQSAWLSG